jgi:TolB-like protein
VHFAFDDYTLDPDRRELKSGHNLIAIPPIAFDLLIFLIRNRDRVVTREDMVESVWQARSVSPSTVASTLNTVRKAIGDTGEDQRLLRTIWRKGIRFVGNVIAVDEESMSDAGESAPGPSGGNRLSPSLPDKPSIAVLPFSNLSGDSEQEYFADGVVEDVILALSRVRWLFVIARNSSFTYKGRAVDIRQVGKELGVRYVLEGSIRRLSNQIRITGRLVDTGTGGQLWADRFEGNLENIFDLQDKVAGSVVGAIVHQMEHAESERARAKPTESLDAYDYYLRGMTKFHLASRTGLDEALPLFYKAIERDPDFAAAYGMASWCFYWRKMNRWLDDRVKDGEEAARLASRAVELGRNDAVALMRGAHCWPHFGGDLVTCAAYVDRALYLNPNMASGWYLAGYQRVSLGQHDKAIEYFTKAMRLSPLDPELFQMQTGIAMAHLYSRRFDEAIECLQAASKELPNILRAAVFMAGACALAGRHDEAKIALTYVQKIDPTLTIQRLDDWIFVQPKDMALITEGLRLAGLPET